MSVIAAMAAKSAVIRAKNRSEFLIVGLNAAEKRLKVLQTKTTHLEKFGWREGGAHWLLLEEALYLVELGAAAVVVAEGGGSATLSLSQLYGLLPAFGLTVFQFAAFRSVVRSNYLVRRSAGDNALLYDYDVYTIVDGRPTVHERLHRFRLFVSRPDRLPSDALRRLAVESAVPVVVAIGSISGSLAAIPTAAGVELDDEEAEE
ncbi:hypothetical protein M3Y99_00559100 [Aphelenchoides fujianensis]|nr:hypothetical protein M3Y99_00559100 [Aphelenchoides fujianensis]